MNRLLALAILLTVSIAVQAEGNRPTTPDDLERIEQLQRRAEKLSFGPLGSNNYTLCKARAWLDMAMVEYHEVERTGIVQDAIKQASQLLDKLEADPAYVGLETPIPYASERVRDDLWELADKLKQDGKLACSGCKLAQLEVQLVWTGHDKWEAGWGHAEPFARIAENLAYEAQLESAQKCSPPKPAVPEERPEDTPFGSVLFDFDRSEVTDAIGKKQLDDLVSQLKSWKKIEFISLVGHADQMRNAGNKDYNMQLSERRVQFVKAFLVARDIPAELIRTGAEGDRRPVVNCAKSKVARNKKLINCMHSNRRVDIFAKGVH